MYEDWRTRLEEASRKLDTTKAAPQWLKDAVRASVKDADALAPEETRADAAEGDFFYPH